MGTFKRSFPSVRLAVLALALAALTGCPSDEDPYCGDGECQLGENESALTCPQDCEAVCGDGSCTANETHASCANDCPIACGDGSCDGAESYQTCPGDCPAPPRCGDGACNGAETSQSCPGDCPAPVCGDGFCEGAENASNCPSDCAVCTGQYPVDCQDGTGCWTAGTNCASNVFTCGGVPRRCALTSNTAFCCSNVFVQCPASFPYYCPVDNLCYAQVPTFCSTATCSFILGDC